MINHETQLRGAEHVLAKVLRERDDARDEVAELRDRYDRAVMVGIEDNTEASKWREVAMRLRDAGHNLNRWRRDAWDAAAHYQKERDEAAFNETTMAAHAHNRDTWARRWKAATKRYRLGSHLYHIALRQRATIRAVHTALGEGQCPTCVKAACVLHDGEPWLEKER